MSQELGAIYQQFCQIIEGFEECVLDEFGRSIRENQIESMKQILEEYLDFEIGDRHHMEIKISQLLQEALDIRVELYE